MDLCFYCKLWTYFTPFSSSVSIVDFEQINVSWETTIKLSIYIIALICWLHIVFGSLGTLHEYSVKSQWKNQSTLNQCKNTKAIYIWNLPKLQCENTEVTCTFSQSPVAVLKNSCWEFLQNSQENTYDGVAV